MKVHTLDRSGKEDIEGVECISGTTRKKGKINA